MWEREGGREGGRERGREKEEEGRSVFVNPTIAKALQSIIHILKLLKGSQKPSCIIQVIEFLLTKT